jgi:hypothetical protein
MPCPSCQRRPSSKGCRLLAPHTPIIADGVVWDVSRDNVLSGYRLSDGKTVFAASTASVGTSFPNLAASLSRLIVPEGPKVGCYAGI